MADSNRPKNPSRWPMEQPAATAPSDAKEPKAPDPRDERGAGRIVHDSRGNAVWNWVKDTGRAALESTSAMLKRLEVPGLNMEGDKDDELRMESDRDAGGGYDPYNQRTPVGKAKPPGKPPGGK